MLMAGSFADEHDDDHEFDDDVKGNDAPELSYEESSASASVKEQERDTLSG